MNNIELNQLKRDLKKFFGYSDEQVEDISTFSEGKLKNLKNDINKIRDKQYEKSQAADFVRKQMSKRIHRIFDSHPGLASMPKVRQAPQKPNFEQPKVRKIEVKDKPKILFICDVRGWAWWIKSQYLKKYLPEYDIDIVAVIGENSIPYNKINQRKYDLYFTYGYSYIDFLYQVPKFKKATGVTAHRAKHMIFPKMKKAGHVHANSMMLLNELVNMGFHRAFYLPNGVDEELFKPIKPIRKDGELIVGHVGKECKRKGQKEYILPAIQMTGVRSVTNMKTYQDKIPHTEMPRVYNQMDVFLVASIEDGTPNPALEAASCGRPIISNAIGNMPELIVDGYNGFIVPKKIGAYAEKIRYFKENRDELIRMGNNARKSILEGWTWKIQAENYRKMFEDIFDRK